MPDSGGKDIARQAQQIVVDEQGSGQRLDNYLLKVMKGVPRQRVYRAVRKGEVRVNRGRARVDYRLQSGDLVRIPPLHQPEQGAPVRIPQAQAARLAHSIVHEDEDLLVVNKPSGLAVHGGSGLGFGLIECLRQLRPQSRHLELVHRLDRETSGLILVAKRTSVLRELHRQFREKQVDKRYLALACGDWPRSLRIVDAALDKNILQSGERMVQVASQGKPAITRFSVLERFREATLLEARPITGRTHQIRVHARHAGHPLLGDAKYGENVSGEVTRSLGLKRLFLHAASLRFSLPGSGDMSFEAPPDNHLEATLNKLRNNLNIIGI